MIDETALTLGRARTERFGDDALDVVRLRGYRSCQRPTAQRAETHAFHFRNLAGEQRQPVVVDDEKLAVAHDGGTAGGKVQRYDLEFLAQDIAPHVALSPVG